MGKDDHLERFNLACSWPFYSVGFFMLRFFSLVVQEKSVERLIFN